MCFSATASFTAAAMLIPSGVYAIRRARQVNPAWVLLAAYPAVFGVQQGIEGMLWLGLDAGDEALVARAARSFLFFSHFFWPAFVPLSVLWMEWSSRRWLAMTIMAAIGGLFGMAIFAPLLIIEDGLGVQVVQHSIQYRIPHMFDALVSNDVLRTGYAFIILIPFALARDLRVRLFGVIIAASLIAAGMFYALTFISVWCFFAAILSLYLVIVLEYEHRQAQPAR